tara:strand:- start:222 stop:530 length:309 start_codon:yes stop_codon:yes gene_type:complete
MNDIFENWRKAIAEDKHSSEEQKVTNPDLMLPKGERKILKADTDEYERGLAVEWLEDGGYDVYYWYKDPEKPVGAELKADGKSVGDDVKMVYLGYHPEIDDK